MSLRVTVLSGAWLIALAALAAGCGGSVVLSSDDEVLDGGSAPPGAVDASLTPGHGSVRTADGCVAWPVTAETPFEPVIEPLGVDDGGAIARAAASLAGSWIGTANAPPDWVQGTWAMEFSFAPDGPYAGRYDARAEASSVVPALYYGTDLPCDLRRWRLLDLQMDGIEGEIDVTFQYPPDPCYLPGWQGEITSLAFDVSANRLRFAFRTSDGHGPVTYDLRRICDPVPTPAQDAGCRVPSNGCDYCGNTVCPTGAVLDSACRCGDAAGRIVTPVAQTCDFCCGKRCATGEFLDYACQCYQPGL